MDERRRLTIEELNERHPRLIPALREHEHVGWILVRSSEHGPLRARRQRHRTTSPRSGSRATTRSRHFSSDGVAAPAPHRRFRATWRTSWWAASTTRRLEEGCAFEELISFHGGLGGPQTRPFILAPVELPLPEDEIIGARRRARPAADVAPRPAGRGRVVGAGRRLVDRPADQRPRPVADRRGRRPAPHALRNTIDLARLADALGYAPLLGGRASRHADARVRRARRS